MGWQPRLIQSTLEAHFNTPKTQNGTQPQPTPSNSAPSHNKPNNINTATNSATTATGSTDHACTIRWSDENFENLVNSLPPLDFKTATHPQLLNMPEQLPTHEACCYFQIRQQNVNKSLLSQQDLLVSLKRDNFNICAIQEPYINHNGMSRENFQWFTVYPFTHTSAPASTRSILLINTNLLTNDWKQIPIPHPDITAIELSSTYGKICLFNIYNNCKNNNALNHLSTYMSTNPTM